MMLSRKMLALVAVAAAPAMAQVTTPPKPKPDPTPPYTPPPPRQLQPDLQPQPRPASVDQIPFEPITMRDAEGKLVPLPEPVEYLAMGHNPLIDLEAMTEIAPLLYPRRLQVEQLVISSIGTMFDIEGGMIESIRLANQDAMREISTKVTALTSSGSLPPYLHNEVTNAFIQGRRISMMTQRIMSDYQETLTQDMMAAPTTDDGSTNFDQMVQAVLRVSVSEHEYFFRRLMMDAADMFGTIMPDLGLDAQTAAAVAPLADRLAGEADLDARAALIREIFGKLDRATQQRVLRKTIDSRPEVDPSAQMAPVPEGASARELDDETRLEMILQLLDGGKVDTGAFIE